MYVVEWDDWAGLRHEITCDTYAEACLEANDLEDRYGYVNIAHK